MPALINWELLAHPANWLIVILMLAIFVAGVTLLRPSLDTIGSLTA